MDTSFRCVIEGKISEKGMNTIGSCPNQGDVCLRRHKQDTNYCIH
jgi:hypothetical protein